MSLLTRIREWAGRKTAEQVAAAQVGIFRSGLPFFNADPTDYQLLQRYKSWVYICCRKNAQAVAQTPLRLYRQASGEKSLWPVKRVDRRKSAELYSRPHLKAYQDDDAEEILSHPLLDTLKTVNAMLGYYELIEYTQTWLDLTGKAYWHLVVNGLGQPLEIWPIPPHMIAPILDRSKMISGYRYGFEPDVVTWTTDEVVRFKCISPLDLIDGIGPLRGALSAVDANQSMANYEMALFANNGVPDWLMTVPGPLSDDEIKRLEGRWQQQYGGTRNRGKMAILRNARDIDLKQIGASNKDMQFTEGRPWVRDEIAAAFDVPKSILTTDEVNRANADAGQHQYARMGLQPRLCRIESVLNEFLVPRYDPSLFLAFDNPVPEDDAFELQEDIGLVTAGIYTPNERRVRRGDLPIEGGDELRGLASGPDPFRGGSGGEGDADESKAAGFPRTRRCGACREAAGHGGYP